MLENYETYEKGFKAKVIEYNETIRTERGYFRVSLPIDLILGLNKTEYYGSEEILPGEIILFVDKNNKTKFENEHFYINDISNCLVNTRGIDIEAFKNTYGNMHAGTFTPIDFIKVNIFLIRREERIIDNDIQIVEIEV